MRVMRTVWFCLGATALVGLVALLIAGSVDTLSSTLPAAFLSRLRTLESGISDYHKRYSRLPESLEELGRADPAMMVLGDPYSPNGSAFGYQVVCEGPTEKCVVLTARLTEPVLTVKVDPQSQACVSTYTPEFHALLIVLRKEMAREQLMPNAPWIDHILFALQTTGEGITELLVGE